MGWSARRRALGLRFAALILDGAVTPSAGKLRFRHLWQSPQLEMLRTRGVTPPAE